MRICTGAIARCSLHLLNMEAKWESIESRRNNQVLFMMYNIVHGDAPTSLLNIFNDLNMDSVDIHHNVRNKGKLRKPLWKTKIYENSFFPYGISVWNELTDETKLKPTLNIFKSFLKKKREKN